MRLATIAVANPRSVSHQLDGQLIVLHPHEKIAAMPAKERYPTLRSAIEDWQRAEPILRGLEQDLLHGRCSQALEIASLRFKSPLPRTWAFLDGSAYLEHVRRVRKSRKAEPPPDLETNPLMYQGLSDVFLDPQADIPLMEESHGLDLEAEIAAVVDFVPMGTNSADALSHIKLLLLLNDISLRNIIPAELAKGFGFLQGKPASSCAPFAVTPDQLTDAWQAGRASLWVESKVNGKLAGRVNSDEMHFSFAELIAHAARTRDLSAGTIIGSGTISNSDQSRGVACLVEKRVLEIIESGVAHTEYLKFGDKISIEAFQGERSVFGAIMQKCVKFVKT